jgi:hypothetical protein
MRSYSRTIARSQSYGLWRTGTECFYSFKQLSDRRLSEPARPATSREETGSLILAPKIRRPLTRTGTAHRGSGIWIRDFSLHWVWVVNSPLSCSLRQVEGLFIRSYGTICCRIHRQVAPLFSLHISTSRQWSSCKH